MRLTQKQIEILQKIKSGNLDGSQIDLTQLRQSLSYTATKQAVLCSINHLAKRGLVARIGKEKRNGALCTILAITSNGEAFLSTYTPFLKSGSPEVVDEPSLYKLKDITVDEFEDLNLGEIEELNLGEIEDLNLGEIDELNFDEFEDLNLGEIDELNFDVFIEPSLYEI